MNADEMFAEQLIEIFTEEIAEVVQQLSSNLLLWKEDLHDAIALKEIRRGFHTIKGSGRMVQAQQMAELAWAVENMLNHVLDKSISAKPSMVLLLEKVITAIPVLLTAFKNKQAAALAGVNVGMLVQHADSLRLEHEVEEIEEELCPEELIGQRSLASVASASLNAELQILRDNNHEVQLRLELVQDEVAQLKKALAEVQRQGSSEGQGLESYSREVKELRYFVKVVGEKQAAAMEDTQRKLNDKLTMELSQARNQRQGEQQYQQQVISQLRVAIDKKVMAWSLSSAMAFSLLTFAAVKYFI